MKSPDVGKFRIQGCRDGLGLVEFEFEGPRIGEDDAFVVEAQVYGVGAQPVAFFNLPFSRFAEQAQGAERCVGQPEVVGQRVFKSPAWKAGKFGVSGQPFEAGGRQFPEGQLVIRFGPDQFGDKQGEAHGEGFRLGEAGSLSSAGSPRRIASQAVFMKAGRGVVGACSGFAWRAVNSRMRAIRCSTSGWVLNIVGLWAADWRSATASKKAAASPTWP